MQWLVSLALAHMARPNFPEKLLPTYFCNKYLRNLCDCPYFSWTYIPISKKHRGVCSERKVRFNSMFRLLQRIIAGMQKQINIIIWNFRQVCLRIHPETNNVVVILERAVSFPKKKKKHHSCILIIISAKTCFTVLQQCLISKTVAWEKKIPGDSLQLDPVPFDRGFLFSTFT